MKNLLLIRHAKSSWDHPGLSDHDRPLNARGERDAPQMAAALSGRGIAPDAIVSSTAVRAATTARVIAGGFGFSEDRIQYTGDLFHASPQTILQVVQQLDESTGTALLFGHNPGMHDAADMFSGDQGVDMFPTLGVARFELEIDYWGEASPGCGFLVELLTPKNLKND